MAKVNAEDFIFARVPYFRYVSQLAFTPQGCAGIVFTQGVRMGRWWQKVYLGCISETIKCRKLTLGWDIGWGCRCEMSCCDLDSMFDLAIVTLSLKIFSGIYLRNHKV